MKIQNILVINAGSSSLKYQLMDITSTKVLAQGNVERIAMNSCVTHKTEQGKVFLEENMPNHLSALQKVISLLSDEKIGVIKDLSEISAVGHRVVHGGNEFTSSIVINDEVEATIERIIPLAPLHNTAALSGIRACKEILSEIPQVAVFDTSFHMTIPKEAHIYAIPYRFYEEDDIRKYGFHGISYRYVFSRFREIYKKDANNSKVIILHLGNGSSITAVKNGKSADTSMGFTPLDGVPMGTRCGSIDPAIIKHLNEVKGLEINEIDNLLNKESGVFGISGTSSDFRDLENAYANGDERAKLAIDMFVYGAKKYIGSFIATMNGLDAIVFSGGIGENSEFIRKKILDDMENLGILLDLEVNKKTRGVESCISSNDSKVEVLVIPTNEELMIATDTFQLLKD